MIRLLCIWLLSASALLAAPLSLRVVTANLTSGNDQSYSPDNGNHSNPEGAGARILKGLQPDLVLIQEFKTTIPTRQWVNETFGNEFAFFQETGVQIPNGIISRHPIVASGKWEDPYLDNRHFAWAKIALPSGSDGKKRMLWAVSVHLYAKKSETRLNQSKELVRFIRENIPKEDFLILGGDLNVRTTAETCLKELSEVVWVPTDPPVDQIGNSGTNASRKRPYDWILPDAKVSRCRVPVKLAGQEFPDGLVFDTRVFRPLEKVPPVQASDSAAPQMQHMAVVQDFLFPDR